jgi:glycerol-3-phosphate O-acyltransferase / dihydroxyacetone phosphate acyltransferase
MKSPAQRRRALRMLRPSARQRMPPQSDALSYRILAYIARIAVRWYYREVVIDGAERIPQQGPVLLVVNHPNELMDALFAGLVAPRQLTFTGKATLFEHPVMNAFLRHLRVVPLRRMQDEAAKGAPEPGANRNADAFAAIHGALASGQIVLIFPEGRTWDEPRLAPIRTGAARIALSAREAGVRGLQIVPLGINYESKESVRSRVLVEVAQPIHIDRLSASEASVDSLTSAIAERLHAVTLNFDDRAEEGDVFDIATVLASTTDDVRPLDAHDSPIAATIGIARRADEIRDRLKRSELPPEIGGRVQQVQQRLRALRHTATTLGIQLDDAALDTGFTAASRFVVREVLLALGGVPLALWGRVNHILAFSLVKWLGQRTSTSRSQFAMNTVVLGAALIPLFYALQTAAVAHFAGWWWAALYVVSLIPSASWDISYTERLQRIRRRARTWRLFRDDPALQARVRTELLSVRDEAARIERDAQAHLAGAN